MYRSLNSYLREQFGCKVYKLAISGGCTCPNRDGTLGTRGCIFCSGSGEFAQDASLTVTEQIENAKALVEKKNKGGKYVAYFQDYTNTYAPAEVLRAKFTEAIAHPDVVAMSVATRPDCLPPDVLELLCELNRIKPVWVELGLQTIHEETAAYIRRGYSLCVYDWAVKELKSRGITVIAHMILGLPGENAQQMVETARYIGKSGADGIKFHLLHVVNGTDLAEEYRKGRVRTLELEQYVTLLEECIRVLPPQTVIHRMTGDGAKKTLLAPLWSADKKAVLNRIRQRFAEDGLMQAEKNL